MTVSWPQNVRLAEMSRGPVRQEFVADDKARKKIAEALDLVSLDHLEATVTVSPWLDGAEMKGLWRASVTQQCVVTLDPLPAHLQGQFTVRLVPQGSPAAPQSDAEIILDPDGEDPPDVLEGDEIDVGAYVVEHLALELDPFPRTPGAEFQPPDLGHPESPFSVLKRLKEDGSDA